jgi:hypothetical protein
LVWLAFFGLIVGGVAIFYCSTVVLRMCVAPSSLVVCPYDLII